MTVRMTVAMLSVALVTLAGCSAFNDSDQKMERDQEVLLAEGNAQIGMPAIKNFRERKLLKDILELRDQEGLVTYTYIANEFPQIASGRTALGGKLTFLGPTIGYGIPYATQFTNPEKYEYNGCTLPQADPNGLFAPSSAEGTWVMMLDPTGGKTVPVYVEPRIVVSPFKLPMD